MMELTPIRVGAIATAVWIVFWTLLFDRWFFWSPLGLLIVFALPAVAWVAWWKFFRVEGEEPKLADMAALGKESAAQLSKLKHRLTAKK